MSDWDKKGTKVEHVLRTQSFYHSMHWEGPKTTLLFGEQNSLNLFDFIQVVTHSFHFWVVDLKRDSFMRNQGHELFVIGPFDCSAFDWVGLIVSLFEANCEANKLKKSQSHAAQVPIAQIRGRDLQALRKQEQAREALQSAEHSFRNGRLLRDHRRQ